MMSSSYEDKEAGPNQLLLMWGGARRDLGE
jgi:hypothetical protein